MGSSAPTAPELEITEDQIESELNQNDLPGSIEDIPHLEEKRPSTTLEIGPEGVAMVESTAPPTRLPPLRNSQDGDGPDGYRQNIDIISNFSEVCNFRDPDLYHKLRLIFYAHSCIEYGNLLIT